MNIICDKTLLSAAIDGVSKAVTLRSTIPVLEGILLKAEGFQLTLTGYDLEMGIVTTIEANVKEPGEIVLNAPVLRPLVPAIERLCRKYLLVKGTARLILLRRHIEKQLKVQI